MALDIASWDKDKIVYRIVPEQISDKEIKEYSNVNKNDAEVNGWTKDRMMRKAGEVPFSFLYNYALAKGVPSTKLWEFFKADNCKEMKRLLNEFECFRSGSKLGVK